jgi:hypothetical protein
MKDSVRDGALPVPPAAVLDNGLKVLIQEAHTAPQLVRAGVNGDIVDRATTIVGPYEDS